MDYPPIMNEHDLRARIVSVAREYSQRQVPYKQPAPEMGWYVRDDGPTELDCSSLVTRLSLVVLGSYNDTLGDPSAATWAGVTPEHPNTLKVVNAPSPGDLVFYQRPGNEHERPVLYHVAVSDGAGKVIAACDVCRHVAEHPEECPHRRWSLLEKPYRQFPFATSQA